MRSREPIVGMPPVAAYAFAVVAAVAVAALRLLLANLQVMQGFTFVFFAVAIVAGAWAGGFGAGMLATVVSMLIADWYFLTPGRLFGERDIIPLAVFVLEGALISWLGHAFRRAALNAHLARSQLEDRVAQRTAELRNANVRLEREVAERHRAWKELDALNVRLEASNRELQEFASVASHDLQEPLRKIQAFGDRLAVRHGAALGDDGREYLDRMLQAARRMRHLIEALLTFARVTTAAQPARPVDLRQIVEEVIADLEVLIEQSGGTVNVGDLPTIEAEPYQMRQLFQNLIGNALKFARPGEPPVVTVSGRILEAPARAAPPSAAPPIAPTPPGDGPHPGGSSPSAAEPSPGIDVAQAAPNAGRNSDVFCELVVEDNGIGFDEKYAERIFAVFQRLHGRTAYEGTGIGLAVCRRIVERHRGTIRAEGRPGRGARFVITLPIHQASAPPPAASDTGPHDPADASP